MPPVRQASFQSLADVSRTKMVADGRERLFIAPTMFPAMTKGLNSSLRLLHARRAVRHVHIDSAGAAIRRAAE